MNPGLSDALHLPGRLDKPGVTGIPSPIYPRYEAARRDSMSAKDGQKWNPHSRPLKEKAPPEQGFRGSGGRI